jgi:hypothetical protein
MERSDCAAHLRKLVAQQRYAEARQVLADYGRLLEAALRKLPPGDPRVFELAREWRDLSEAVRRQVLAGRAHAAARLARLPHRRGLRAGLTRQTWELFG